MLLLNVYLPLWVLRSPVARNNLVEFVAKDYHTVSVFVDGCQAHIEHGFFEHVRPRVIAAVTFLHSAFESVKSLDTDQMVEFIARKKDAVTVLSVQIAEHATAFVQECKIRGSVCATEKLPQAVKDRAAQAWAWINGTTPI